MRRKRIFLAAVVLVLLPMLFCGCGSVKTAWVAGKFAGAVKRNPVTGVTGELTGTVRGKTLGLHTQTGLQLQFTTDSDPNGKTYSELSGTAQMLGMDLDQNIQIFGLPDGENTICYVHLEKPDLWARGKSKVNPDTFRKLDPSLLTILAQRTSDPVEIQKVERSGKKQYQLGFTIQGKNVQQYLRSAGEKVPEKLRNLDLTGTDMPLRLWLDADSYLPQGLEISLEGMDGPFLEALFNMLGRELQGVDMESGELKLKVTGFRYGVPELPPLPAEAVENAAKMEELRELLQRLMRGK